VQPKVAVVDLGYRGVDHLVPVEVVHRNRYKTMPSQQRRWLKRSQAIEPLIGHAKQDHGMRRCWLKGAEGDALNAVLCAAGFNICWLLRAIVRLDLQGLGLLFAAAQSWLAMLTTALSSALLHHAELRIAGG